MRPTLTNHLLFDGSFDSNLTHLFVLWVLYKFSWNEMTTCNKDFYTTQTPDWMNVLCCECIYWLWHMCCCCSLSLLLYSTTYCYYARTMSKYMLLVIVFEISASYNVWHSIQTNWFPDWLMNCFKMLLLYLILTWMEEELILFI